MLCVGPLTPFLNKLYIKSAAQHGGIAPPEARLHGGMIGALAIPVGLFWFAWTNGKSIPWISPVAAGAPFGFGLTLVFLSVTTYLIDAYTIFAASVLAANTVLRSLFAAAFPLFTEHMYTNLGIHWASAVPGFLALACMPFPFVFYKYGGAIRKRCVYSAEAERVMKEMRAQVQHQPKEERVDDDDDDEDPDGKGSRLSWVTCSEGAPDAAVDPDPADADADQIETDGPHRFEAIRAGEPSTPHRSMSRRSRSRRHSRGESIIEAAEYGASPYDIDREYTTRTITGLSMTLPLLEEAPPSEDDYYAGRSFRMSWLTTSTIREDRRTEPRMGL